MSQRNASPDVDTAFAEYFNRFATSAPVTASSPALTESNPAEFLRFVETRFRRLVDGFTNSFFDSSTAIGTPFRNAAGRRGEP